MPFPLAVEGGVKPGPGILAHIFGLQAERCALEWFSISHGLWGSRQMRGARRDVVQVERLDGEVVVELNSGSVLPAAAREEGRVLPTAVAPHHQQGGALTSGTYVSRQLWSTPGTTSPEASTMSA